MCIIYSILLLLLLLIIIIIGLLSYCVWYMPRLVITLLGAGWVGEVAGCFAVRWFVTYDLSVTEAILISTLNIQ